MNTRNMLTGMLLLVFLFSYDLSNAQEEKEKYVMYTTIAIKVVKGKEKEFEKAVLAHNKQFHPEGTYQAFLRAILTGPKAGSYTWITGPNTFSDFDSAPGEGAHNDDWTNNVDQYVKHYGTVEHWKRNKELSFTAEGTEGQTMSQVWFIDVKNGKNEQFKKALATAIKVTKKQGTDTVHTYNSQFSGGDGRDVAMVFGMEGWSSFDDDDTFYKDYEAMHGEGSFQKFLQEWTGATNGMVQVVTQLVTE